MNSKKLLPPSLPGLKAERSRTEPGNSDYLTRNLEDRRSPKLTSKYYEAIGAYFVDWNHFFDILNLLFIT